MSPGEINCVYGMFDSSVIRHVKLDVQIRPLSFLLIPLHCHPYFSVACDTTSRLWPLILFVSPQYLYPYLQSFLSALEKVHAYYKGTLLSLQIEILNKNCNPPPTLHKVSVYPQMLLNVDAAKKLASLSRV